MICLRAASAAVPDAEIVDADICTLTTKTFAFDRKLVRVSALVARDFETFWIQGDNCRDDASPLWLEYGGPKPADGPKWYGELSHPPDGKTSLYIQGIEIPLEANAMFRKFDSLTKSLKIRHFARATLVGRVFATGSYKDDAGQDQEIGYGPYGMYSLFVIQRVEKVSRK